MALDYTTTNTGIFYRGGKLIKYINSRLATATTTIPAELKAIADPFEAADMTGQISGLYADMESFRQSIRSERSTLAGYWNNILTDRDTVLDELNVSSATPTAVLPELFRRMIADSASVDASTVTIGSVSGDATNKGNGTVLITKLLDGYNPPLQGGLSIIDYAGLDSQLAVPSEIMIFTCQADNARDGLTEGSERFSWIGGIADERMGYQAEGSGDGPSLTAAGESQIIQNGNFENWSSNTPTGWTIVTGTAGTHIKETTSAGTFYRGESALWFDGDGSLAAMQIDQAPSTGAMTSRRLYCVTARVKASASSGTGALTIQFAGTGYTASSSEKVAITAGSMPTSWTLYHFWIVTPAVIPSNWRLTISNSGTPGGSSDVYVDSVIVTEGIYHGGVAAVVVPGSSQFAVGDRFSATISNDQAGVFQEFFRQWYGVQLPSNNAGSETINDSLAT